MDRIEWKKWGIVGVVCLVLCAVSYGFGRYGAPDKVVEREKVRIEKVEVEKQVVVVQEKIKVERIYLAETSKRIHREETCKTYPDGTVESKKTEDINVDKIIREQDVKFVDKVVEKMTEKINYVDRIVEKEKIVERERPNWRLGVMAGYDVGYLTSDPGAGLVFGGIAERRILGPVSVGLWGTSAKPYGTYGVMVSLEL